MKLLISTIFLVLSIQNSECKTPYKICAIEHTSDCTQLERSDSEVRCVPVQDSIECAQRLANGTADFGVFSAENLLHLSLLDVQNDVFVIIELRHERKITASSDFQSVAVVRKEHTGGLKGLQGYNFCHPGLHYGHRWSERFLKHFERTVAELECFDKSPAETEAISLTKFFGKMCRPGVWTHNEKENEELKNKYPSLCELCDGKCEYISSETTPHKQALDCLLNRGHVAYVSLDDAQEYFKVHNESVEYYRFLCPNGTLENITRNTNVCTWLRQPWGTIVANNVVAANLKQILVPILVDLDERDWKTALKRIVGTDLKVSPKQSQLVVQKPGEHVRAFRPIPVDTSTCPRSIRWCTTSPEENDKCKVVRAAGMSLGVFPAIECNEPTTDTLSCLYDVSTDKADFVSIDSSYGYVARKMYNLASALYFETDNNKYAQVAAVVKTNSKFNDLKSLKGARACLPLFGGTSTMAFINTGKNQGLFAADECNYGQLLHDFFGESCVPGARDPRVSRKASDNPDSLCSLCKSNISPATGLRSDPSNGAPANCKPDKSNRYYGNIGALRCLNLEGDVAILELQYLKEQAKSLNLTESDFQIICRNGERAPYPGFDVDRDCLLTFIVDGEVVVNPKSNRMAGVINVLKALDKYFQSDPDFKMYNVFAGEKDLLFKDSTLGLTVQNEKALGPAVRNYFDLFSSIEGCIQKTNAVDMITSNIFLIILATIAYNIIINNYLQ